MHGAHEDREAQEFDTRLRVDEIEPDCPRPIATPWGEFSLFRLDEGVAAVQSFCPHLGGPLFQGTRSGDELTCPWHLWCFSLRSGERVDARAGSVRLARCPGRLGPEGTWILDPPAFPPRVAGERIE